MKAQMQKINFLIPIDLYRFFKDLAFKKQTTMTKILLEYVQSLEKEDVPKV